MKPPEKLLFDITTSHLQRQATHIITAESLLQKLKTHLGNHDEYYPGESEKWCKELSNVIREYINLFNRYQAIYIGDPSFVETAFAAFKDVTTYAAFKKNTEDTDLNWPYFYMVRDLTALYIRSQMPETGNETTKRNVIALIAECGLHTNQWFDFTSEASGSLYLIEFHLQELISDSSTALSELKKYLNPILDKLGRLDTSNWHGYSYGQNVSYYQRFNMNMHKLFKQFFAIAKKLGENERYEFIEFIIKHTIKNNFDIAYALQAENVSGFLNLCFDNFTLLNEAEQLSLYQLLLGQLEGPPCSSHYKPSTASKKLGSNKMQEITNEIYLRILNFATDDKFPLLIRCRTLYLQQGKDSRDYKLQLAKKLVQLTEAKLVQLTNDDNNNNDDTATSKQDVCELLDTHVVNVINQAADWYKVKECFKLSINPSWVGYRTLSKFVDIAASVSDTSSLVSVREKWKIAELIAADEEYDPKPVFAALESLAARYIKDPAKWHLIVFIKNKIDWPLDMTVDILFCNALESLKDDDLSALTVDDLKIFFELGDSGYYIDNSENSRTIPYFLSKLEVFDICFARELLIGLNQRNIPHDYEHLIAAATDWVKVLENLLVDIKAYVSDRGFNDCRFKDIQTLLFNIFSELEALLPAEENDLNQINNATAGEIIFKQTLQTQRKIPLVVMLKSKAPRFSTLAHKLFSFLCQHFYLAQNQDALENINKRRCDAEQSFFLSLQGEQQLNAFECKLQLAINDVQDNPNALQILERMQRLAACRDAFYELIKTLLQSQKLNLLLDLDVEHDLYKPHDTGCVLQ